MSTLDTVADAVADAAPFVAIMLLWTGVTGVVYLGFIVTWPVQPDAQPWMSLGVYVLPIVGYIGHTLQQALKLGGQ